MNLPKSEKYDMYYAVYPDGTQSADFYSYTRALEHTKCIPESERWVRRKQAGYGRRKPVGEFKPAMAG